MCKDNYRYGGIDAASVGGEKGTWIIDLHEDHQALIECFIGLHNAQYGFNAAYAATGCTKADETVLPLFASPMPWVHRTALRFPVPKGISCLYANLQVQFTSTLRGNLQWCSSDTRTIIAPVVLE